MGFLTNLQGFSFPVNVYCMNSWALKSAVACGDLVYMNGQGCKILETASFSVVSQVTSFGHLRFLPTLFFVFISCRRSFLLNCEPIVDLVVVMQIYLEGQAWMVAI